MPPDAPLNEEVSRARQIAAGLPDILIEARHIASTVLAGWHGRRASGRGETFWQFRPFVPGEAAASIDWRRSARDDHLYVRETEWEAAHTVWFWADQSPSMEFRSRIAQVTKRQRATVLMLALTELMAAGGERVGLMGTGAPILARHAAEQFAIRLPLHAREAPQPVIAGVRRMSDAVLIGDFLDPVEETEALLEPFVRNGVRAHLIQVTDPAEEVFPYAGRTEFLDPETGQRHLVSRAEQYRDDYARRLTALRERLGDRCRRVDWTFLVHRTDAPATEPILALHARLSDRNARLLDNRRGAA